MIKYKKEIRRAGLDISPEELAQIKQVDKAKAKRFAESFATEFGTRKQQSFGWNIILTISKK